MIAGKLSRHARCALVVWLLFIAPLGHGQLPISFTQGVPAAGIIITNQPVPSGSATSARPPLPPATKRKAGFMAGAGLAILSLLALAAGLALVRTFKR